jgi:hypothetical protein
MAIACRQEWSMRAVGVVHRTMADGLRFTGRSTCVGREFDR